MATATITRPSPPPPPKEVTLVLSHKEAAALSIVLANVGGCPRSTARGLTDGIQSALCSVGINGVGHYVMEPSGGGMSFREGSLQAINRLCGVSK